MYIIIIGNIYHSPIQYLLFEYPPDLNDVRVKITSDDDTRDICAIASIQNVYVSAYPLVYECIPPSMLPFKHT